MKSKPRVHIINGNTKIGKTPNISLPPVIACGKNSEYCKDGCYAVKFYNLYPSVKFAWNENYAILLQDRKFYFDSIRRYLLRTTPRYFRWHVSGDLIDQDYLDNVIRTAKDYSLTFFLLYTKQYDFSYLDVPKNLAIIFSIWPGLPIQCKKFPLAFIEGDDRAYDTFLCPEHCETCRACWNLTSNVLLRKKRGK